MKNKIISQDISERKRAEEELRTSNLRYRRLFEAARDGILILDAETGMVVDVNPFLVEMLGYSREQFFGKTIWELGFFKDIAASKLHFTELQRKEFIQYENLPLETAKGRLINVEFVSHVYQVGRNKVIQCNIRDITERKQAGEKLIIANKELAFQNEEKEKRAAELIIANKELAFQNQEKEKRAAELIVANEELRKVEDDIRKLNDELEQKVIERTTQLQAVNKELEAFSYSVSHDLIAPLRSIDGFSQALLKDYDEKLDEEGKDFLRRVRAASQRMAQLIDDMLKLSHITRADMRRERVDLSMIVREVADELQKAQPARRVEFIIADGMIDYGDPQLLRVVIENLLGNSWKYTGKNPAARIEFGVTHHDSRKAYYVRDNGVGFDMAYADKLFGAFQRLHSMAEFEGTGIGLATVQRIIHRHGGRVWAEAKINEGATFYFSL